MKVRLKGAVTVVLPHSTSFKSTPAPRRGLIQA
jgi:hypothetical protein